MVNPQGKRTSLAHDLADRLTRQIHGNGSITTQIYDGVNQMTCALTDANSHVTSYPLDPLGRETNLQTPDGASQTRRLKRRGNFRQFQVTKEFSHSRIKNF